MTDTDTAVAENPYISTLRGIAIGGLGLGVVIAVIAVIPSVTIDAAALLAWAFPLGGIGAGAMLVWLLAGALTWKPPAK